MTTHYLGVIENREVEEYNFHFINGEDRYPLPWDNRSQLTVFANLVDVQIEKLKCCCNIALDAPTIAEYIESVHEEIAKILDESSANVITLELRHSLRTSDKPNENPESFSNEDARNVLLNTIDSAVWAARLYCQVLSSFFDEDSYIQQCIAHMLEITRPSDIRYIPVAATCKKNQKVTFCNAYYVSNVEDFFFLIAVFTIKEGKPIRRCKNCNKYFIPASKIDEIYCLSCRNVSYDTKIKEDEILSSYRKIYKTQSARKKRNSHRPLIEEKFEQWKRMASSKRNECKSGLITLEEMEKAISSKDWLDGIGGINGNN